MRRELFTTNVGSHMWGMARPDSDTDLFKVYIASTREMMEGTARVDSHFDTNVGGKNVDVSEHEIGKVVDMVLKGNVNFLWGVLSPIVVNDDMWVHQRLRELTLDNLSKNCAKSIYGMAKHNYQRYVRDGMGSLKIADELLEKKCNTVLRTLLFGINLLEGKGPIFSPYTGGTMKDIEYYMEQLLRVEKESTLPVKPMYVYGMRELLFLLRSMEYSGYMDAWGISAHIPPGEVRSIRYSFTYSMGHTGL